MLGCFLINGVTLSHDHDDSVKQIKMAIVANKRIIFVLIKCLICFLLTSVEANVNNVSIPVVLWHGMGMF